MILRQATNQDISYVREILGESFADNLSSNYVLKQSGNLRYLKRLMKYSIRYCTHFGYVFINDEKNAACLLVDPRKKNVLAGIRLNIYFIFRVCGLKKLKAVLRREKIMKENHKKFPNAIHLWFIGVGKASQEKGFGSLLLNEVIDFSEDFDTILLETSNEQNLPWYQKHGFEIYDSKWIENHDLYFLKRGGS